MNNCKVPTTLPRLCLLLAIAGIASAQQFVRAPIFSAGDPSLSVASGDFNGDGNPDLAFLSTGGPALLNIRLGTSDGKFSEGQQIALSDLAVSLLAGDWNNDGVLDLAVGIFPANYNTSVSILMGKGDGTFVPQGSLAVPLGVHLLASGDLNGDGVADLVVANRNPGVSVLLGLGGGNFGPAILLDTQLDIPTYSVAVADLNHDGKADIAAVGDDSYDGVSALAVFLGNGDGTFAAPAGHNTTYNSFSNLVVADFNNDGIPDLADTGDNITVHLGRGDGTFRRPALFDGSTSFLETTSGPRESLAAADINQDGNLDILSLDYNTNILDVLLGNGDGTFQERSLFGTGPCPKSIAVADLNHDGNLDVAVPDSCDNNFVELAGNGAGNFVTRRSYSPRIQSQLSSVASGYLDSDNNLDLVVVDVGAIDLLLGAKHGGFKRGAMITVTGRPEWVITADLNGDGKNDVVTADQANNSVSVFLGNGDGKLQPEHLYATGSDPRFVAAADVNGDGKLDLLTANDNGNSFSVLLGGASGFLSHRDYSVKSPVRLALGDFNEDGKLDLVTVSRSGTGTIFLGKGDGSFSAGATLDVPGTLTSVAIGDLNHDGKLDVVIAASSSAVLYSFLGNGDGTFQPSLTSMVPDYARQVLLADFDSDSNLDAMVIGGNTEATAAASLLLGKGDGTFGTPQIYTADQAPVAGEAVDDFNADGALDVVFTSGTGGTVSVLYNRKVQ